jgi:DNA-binding NarL/FixJ family response regulator
MPPTHTPALLGRETLIDHLESAIAARESSVLCGEPGIGKTAILEAVRGRFRGPGAYGHAVAALQWIPYLPLSNACGVEFRGPPAEVVLQIRSMLQGGALFLDDLQWADVDTLDTLPELALEVPIVAAVRRGEPATEKALETARACGAVIDVEPLGTDAARALAAAALPNATRRQLGEVVRHARGNPLLLTCPVVDSEHGVDTDRIEALVRRASPAARHSLARLALSGRTRPRGEVVAVAELEALGLLADDAGSCQPRHELFGVAAVRMLSDVERAQIHRDLAASAATDGERARHLLAAHANADARRCALRAAAAAVSPNERAEHYSIAARTITPGSAENDVLFEASEAILLAGRAEEALDLARRATTATTSDRIRGLTALARAAWWSADYALAERTIAEGLALADGTDTTAEVALRVLHARYLNRVAWDPAGAMIEAERAVALAETLEVSRAEAYGALGAACTSNGDPAWRTWLRRSLAAARAEGAFAVESTSADTLFFAELMAGDAGQCPALAEDMVDRARAQGAVTTERQFRKNLLLARFHVLGQLTEIVVDARALLRLPLNARQRDHVESHLVLALAHLGDDDDVAVVLQSAFGFSAHDQTSRATILWAKAEADFAAGRFGDALATAAECRTLPVLGFPAQVMVEPVRQWSALELGLDPGPAMTDGTFPNLEGAKLESAAIVAMYGSPSQRSNVEGFLNAANAWARLSQSGALRCRWAAGEAAVRAGRNAEAIEVLQPLQAELRMQGEQPLLRRVQRTLRAAGARVRPLGGPHVGPLTPSETEVIGLVARGLDTKCIAARLLIREATVDTHVRTAVAKLGAPNRLAAGIRMLRMDASRETGAGQRVVVASAAAIDAACASFESNRTEYHLHDVPLAPWQLSPDVVVRAWLFSDEDVQRALLAAARGVSMAVVVDSALSQDARAEFFADLDRLGCDVTHYVAPPIELDAQLRCALELLGEGATVASAAQSLFMSERTLHRRLASLRRRLGATTNASVAQIVLGEHATRSRSRVP